MAGVTNGLSGMSTQSETAENQSRLLSPTHKSEHSNSSCSLPCQVNKAHQPSSHTGRVWMALPSHEQLCFAPASLTMVPRRSYGYPGKNMYCGTHPTSASLITLQFAKWSFLRHVMRKVKGENIQISVRWKHPNLRRPAHPVPQTVSKVDFLPNSVMLPTPASKRSSSSFLP